MGRTKLLIMEVFNHKEINGENLESNEGSKMLETVLENFMHQQVRDTTRERERRGCCSKAGSYSP